MNYKTIKEKLQEKVSSIKYFTKEVFNQIMADREQAGRILETGGNPQEFYRNCATSKTKFYKENSVAYCALLEILE